MTDTQRKDIQSWTETMTARERVRAVAETLNEPRSTNWISTQADASWSTTDEELTTLVEQGWLRRVETDDAIRYKPDYTRLLFTEIQTLIVENTRAELRTELTAITEEIESWQEEYSVDTWEALEQTLANGDLSSASLRKRRDVIAFWRENEQDRRLIKHALELYTDVKATREQTEDTLERVTG